MLHSITVAKRWICALILCMLLLMTCLTLVQSKALANTHSLPNNNINSHNNNDDNNGRQFLFLKGVGGETSTPDFIRLVVMRFIYGLASTIGVEDRLEGLFNGAFVPPNADGDLFGLGGFGDDGADVGGFDEAAFSGIFDDDVF